MRLSSRDTNRRVVEQKRGAGGSTRTPQPRRVLRRDGFTLLETMIALGLLAFGILAVAAAQLASLDLSRRSRSLTQAMYLADQQLELFHSMSAASVLALLGDPDFPNDPNNPIDPNAGDDDTTTYLRSWNIQPDTPEVGVISLRVQVRWTDELGVNRDYFLDGMKADL